MEALYRFLDTYAGLVYILLALGGLFALRWLWISWQEWRLAIYGLEKEFALRRMSRALAAVVLILILLLAEFFVISFIIPGLPAAVFAPTPTLDLLAAPTATLPPEAAAMLSAAPAPIVSVSDAGCVPERLNIVSPEPGEQVSGSVELIGTVDIPNLGFYKVEVALQDSENWASVFAGRTPRRNQPFENQWDTSLLTPGDYLLRLVVTDNEGQSLPPCVIPVRVTAP